MVSSEENKEEFHLLKILWILSYVGGELLKRNPHSLEEIS
jgi:hypothetical protein